jgi:hypothetical protein
MAIKRSENWQEPQGDRGKRKKRRKKTEKRRGRKSTLGDGKYGGDKQQ